MLTRIVFAILVSIIVSGSIRIGLELRDEVLYGDAKYIRDDLKNGPISNKILVMVLLILSSIILSPLGFTMILINYNSRE